MAGLLEGEQLRSNINTVVIHCAKTPNGDPALGLRSLKGKPDAAMLEVDAWHRARKFKRRAWARELTRPQLTSFGYHYAVFIGGRIKKGRDICEMGSHAYGKNHNSIGIVLFGTDQFTAAQFKALHHLLFSLNEALPQKLKVIGHRDVLGTAKSCPNFDVKKWVATKSPIAPAGSLFAETTVADLIEQADDRDSLTGPFPAE